MSNSSSFEMVWSQISFGLPPGGGGGMLKFRIDRYINMLHFIYDTKDFASLKGK